MTCKTKVLLLDATDMNFLCACVGVHLRGHPKTPEGGLSRWRPTETWTGDAAHPRGAQGELAAGPTDFVRESENHWPPSRNMWASGCGSSACSAKSHQIGAPVPGLQSAVGMHTSTNKKVVFWLRKTLETGRDVALPMPSLQTRPQIPLLTLAVHREHPGDLITLLRTLSLYCILLRRPLMRLTRVWTASDLTSGQCRTFVLILRQLLRWQ